MRYFYTFILFALSFPLFAQVKVDINSGDPAYPFPQFLAYESVNHTLGNLATNNAQGVTHAEMEQTIRDAYQIMANRFEYSGETYSGVQYIKANIGCPYDCTEGDGYGLLAAAEMADKKTFDGIWFRTHDAKMIKYPRYRDCVVPDPGYQYGQNSLKDNTDSAADGDFDIALALCVAWKQWGDDSGYKDACGNIISYKEEALRVIRGLVEKTERPGLGDCRRVSGDIGFDGYIKGGNTWKELTDWATGTLPECPEFNGPTNQHIDYAAPSYFNEFSKFLESEGDVNDKTWNIKQFDRAEASSDWLMGKMLDNPSTLPLAGWVALDGANNPTYSNFLDGEDFRNPWRTILNYVWHGDPKTSWNPTTHQVDAGGNSYEQNIGKRLAKFLTDPGQTPWGNDCSKVGGGPALSYNGPSQIKQYYNPITGKEQSTFPLNWLSGTGSPAAVAAQDFDLMGKLYRQCAIEWDITEAGDGYLTSKPGYFHGFFRLLGMLTLSGNHQAPMGTKLEANMKVYHAVDKTFAFTGDEITYTISYRNYASVAANGVAISTVLPKGVSFVSASNGGTNSGGTVNWAIATVPGFKTTTGIQPTIGEVSFKVKVDKGFSGRICNTVAITTTNGKGWKSNEYPNNQTAVMERNCVDIVEKALEIKKTVDYTEVNPGDKVTYTLDFENASSGGFINGGRTGVIPAYAHGGTVASGSEHLVKIRLYHGATEPYIDYGNYRISMFINDNALDCVAGEPGCGIGWQLDSQIYEGGDRAKVNITSEVITPGSDTRGSWNQRVIVKFSEQLATITPHVSRYFGIEGGRVHLGGAEPLRAVWQMHASNWSAVQWDDDWSWDPAANDASDGLYYPITNDWTDPDNPNVPVTIYHNEACEKPSKTVDNVLVEEWDGYTWRRVFGNGPLPGREVEDVVLKDVLPVGFTFEGFIDDKGINVGNTITILGEPVTYDATTRTISWKKSKLQVKQAGIIKYVTTADFSSGTCTRADEIQTNTASIEGENESPKVVTTDVNVTCNPVTLPPPPSSMTKIASPMVTEVGKEVTYTLEYTNTDGSPIEADLSSTSDWVSQSGAPMTILGGELTNVANDLGVMTSNYSYGTDGIIETTINFNPSAAFGIAMRHTGGAITNGVYIVFKPNPGAGLIDTSVYDGTTLLENKPNISFPGDPTTIKIQLANDQLSLWVGNTTNPTPTWTVSGLPVRVGYAGVINGFPNGNDAYGTHKVTRFYTKLDAAFDLQITDPIPAEVSFVSATDGGVDTAGIVTYPVIPGPVLAGEVISYSWVAEINSCPATTSEIVNTAYTNIKGVLKNTIAAQVIINCSGVDICANKPDPPIVVDFEYCKGDIPDNIINNITATGILSWYSDVNGKTSIVAPIIDTSLASSATYYVSQSDAKGCESDVVPITVRVDGGPVGTNSSEIAQNNQPFSHDLMLDVNVPATYSWVATDHPNVTGETLSVSTSAIISETLLNTTDQIQTVEYTVIPTAIGSGCIGDSFVVSVLVYPSNGLSIMDTQVIEGGDMEFLVTLSAPVTENLTLTFSFINITTTDSDYDTSDVQITIPKGSDEAIVIVPTVDDNKEEVNETFSIAIKSVDQGVLVDSSATATGKIIDNNGVPSVLLGDMEVVEGGTLYFPIQLSNPSLDDILITFVFTDITANNTDYDTATIQLSIPAGDTDTVLSVPTFEDTIAETTETFEIAVGSVDAGIIDDTTDIGIGKIVDNDGSFPIVLIGDATITEGGILEFPISLSNPILDDITLFYSFTDATADATDYDPVDYQTTILSGATTGIVRVLTMGDQLVELDETFTLGIQEVRGGTVSDFSDTAIGTIIDNDMIPTITVDDDMTTEGGILVFPVHLGTPGIFPITLTFLVQDITTDPTDYLGNTLEITIAAGAVDGIVSLNTVIDMIEEPAEQLQLNLMAIDGVSWNGVNVSATGTITDLTTDDITLTIFDAAAAEGDVMQFPMFLSAPSSQDIIVGINFFDGTADGTDYDAREVTVTIPAGSLEEYAILDVFNDKIVEPDEIFTAQIVSMSFGNIGIEDTAVGTIFDIVPEEESNTFPLFFTPNEDPYNNTWQVGEELSSLILKINIYDRYGKLLKQLNPDGNGWDGRYNGNNLPASDYWFVANFKDGKVKRGHFSLIR